MTRVLPLLLVCWAASAAAGQQAFKAEVTPFVGARFGGQFEDQDTGESLRLEDGDASYGLLVNWWHSPVTEWEVGVSHQDASVKTADLGVPYNLSIDYLQIGGTYLGDGQTARPYVVATLGAAFLDPESSAFGSETAFAFSIGGGFKFFPRQRFGLRAEGRFYGTVLDSDSKIFCGSGAANAGCIINTKADVLWQWEMLLGGIVRF